MTPSHVCTDGGNTDNFGMLVLLRRQVKNLIVFINTSTPIETDVTKIKSRFEGIDPTLMSYFGYSACILYSSHCGLLC